MRVLAIETSGEACSVALFEGARQIDAAHKTIGRGHAEWLVPMVAQLPGKGRADKILVSLGPGSFTGVRIGLAAARALSLAWGAEVQGYPTLSLIAAMAHASVEGPVDICMNGGHGEWFVQSFDEQGFPSTAAASVLPEQAVLRLTNPVVAGNRAQQFADLAKNGVRIIDLMADARFANLIPPALHESSLTPLYGREPDAKAPIQ